MGVSMKVVYEGQLHCELTHGPSGTKISTDAPKDNMGKGEAFSPTDLVGAALASCIVTTMAIVAQRDGIAFEGATAEVTKEMSSEPRRVGALPVTVRMPASLPEAARKKLENAARHCPVEKSIHPDIKREITFIYG
jgi:uncharacterized OsmC-like protein